MVNPVGMVQTWWRGIGAREVGVTALIIACILWIYWPALHGGWLWDDDYLLQKNDLVHEPGGIFDIWFNPTTLIDYFPMTVTVEWLEWQLWGSQTNTLCFHLTNVILHMFSALLVWRLFSKLGIRLAWLGGLLFAVHPLMVESVAWMAEIKNSLSMPPFLLAAAAWVDFEKKKKEDYYLLSLCFFLLAMLCKTTMVAFPVVILLYAWYLRGRIAWRDILRTLPFFFISISLSIVLILLLRHGVGEETIPLGGIMSRLACAGTSLAFYFAKGVLPLSLAPIYPQWNVRPPSPIQFVPWLALALAFGWLWHRRATWGRYAILGFGFFFLNLAPFVGFRAISFMRFGWVMDHIVFIPFLGLLGLGVAALGQLEENLKGVWRPVATAALAALIAVFAYGSHEYAEIYQNSETLWAYTAKLLPQAWPAHNNLGNALTDQGRVAEATLQYREALDLNPGYPEAHNNLGLVLMRTGDLAGAINEFKLALYYCPQLQAAQMNLATALNYQQQAQQAALKGGPAPLPPLFPDK